MTQSETPPSSDGTRRRDLLATGTVVLGCAGACALTIPFVESLKNPAATSPSARLLDVDLSSLKPGQDMTVRWRDWPVFIQRRTPQMLAVLQTTDHLATLRDADSKVLQQPKDATNWHRSVRPEYGVLIGICTHLGCVPSFEKPGSTPEAKGGYFCPCHGSHFDAAGRVARRAPAPCNLPVPPVTFLSDTKLRIGHSAGDPGFSMSDIQQI
ncbi:ubiquinol-cytochrome c reductase iron-sulfur subunit [Gluconobacter sphaericus]|uniref:ubiquinol-cytochrome c reductase iron-sulfur subunit n=1 Tax=Gluconobacter sphaericus TaxID=574987 RepID=UPI001B8D7FD7|nr:ubiquinol-cytochrome c reductase iron-sulfur subunit [Gluconobacter sphaericus]MBS1085910.1 ubiquinol-cytochrome c reductase iron-sulfur subunit [Gluconobacter sphaericus]MBS1099694.1 ubiquinol-cytochrome c reductase iron-sulfur subunit [Gluconobacter sphaericus]